MHPFKDRDAAACGQESNRYLTHEADLPAKPVLRNVPDRNAVGHILPDHDGLAKTIPVTLTKSQATMFIQFSALAFSFDSESDML